MSHYILYIDDTGSRNPDYIEINRNDGMDCFGLGGIMVDEGEVDEIVKKFKEFQFRWDIAYPLHSTEIRGMRGKFFWLSLDTKIAGKFHKDLSDLMASINVIGFAAIVDRKGYNEAYKDIYGENRWPLCRTAYSILIERAAKFCDSTESTMEVVFEEAGKNEDRALIRYHRALKDTGHPFDVTKSSKYCQFNPLDYKRVVKGDPRRGTKRNIFLQIADIYLYPMAKYGYDPLFAPWHLLFGNKRIIDSLLSVADREVLGIKYSCFPKK